MKVETGKGKREKKNQQSSCWSKVYLFFLKFYLKIRDIEEGFN